ncbi:MAG TPA: hypothetical protein DCF62_06740 [Porticoccaceae bacterium]|nr:hypothetical protein [Porticoccaceae bacterium]HCO60242.1 hypothetical protein [Porticoccaceae bacterium]
MYLDPMMPRLVAAILVVLLLGLSLRAIRQPYVFGYLLAGILLGPHGIALLEDEQILMRLGSAGVVLLLFFVGMEVSPNQLIERWRVAVIGTFLQIIISVACVWPIGIYLDWAPERILLIGFVISMSSTAILSKLLKDEHMSNTSIGQNVLLISLAQDLAVIPMIIVLSLLVGQTMHADTGNIWLQIAGAVSMLLLVAYISVKKTLHLPLKKLLRNDREMQLFAALTLCLGLSLLTGLLGLSTALGAFFAGMIIRAARETHWVSRSLESFRIIFVALFFVSIGMLINLRFIADQWLIIITLVLLAMLTNTFINAAILRSLGETWRDSMYAGTLLSQIGEFSFVLAAVGIQAHIITEYGYQLTVAVIAITLLISPSWIIVTKHMLKIPSTRRDFPTTRT